MDNLTKTKQLDYWINQFGDRYTRRNADLTYFRKRSPFFRKLLRKHSGINSVLEIGCNLGGNLIVLSKIDPMLKIVGVEPNSKAWQLAKKNLPNVNIYNLSIFDVHWKNEFDLVFTSGVLIHIADKELNLALRKIYQASKKYILSIEYYSDKIQSIPYRGLKDALFKRPFSFTWQKQYPSLSIINQGFLTKDQGFDNCHWWLFQK